MRRGLILAALLVVAASSVQATPLVWRQAKMMAPMSLEAYLGVGYFQTARGYNWTDEAWQDLTDAQKTTVIKLMPAVYFAPVKNLELGVVAPLASKSKDTLSSSGLGDAWINARYGLLQGKLIPVMLTLSAAAVLPTAPEDANPTLGDRTFDIGVAAVAQTKSIAGFSAHARAGYWLNGSYTRTVEEMEQTVDVGDGVEWLVKGVYAFSKKANVWVTLCGMFLGNSEVDGDEVANSAVDRAAVWVGAVVKPLPVVKLAVRPKVGVFLEPLSRGGGMQPWEAGVDFWLAVP